MQRIERTLQIDLENPSAPAKAIFRRNERDAYHDPGTPALTISPDGRREPLQQGDEIYLAGQGASPSGDQPFLDRFNLTTGKAERMFHSSSGFEEVVAVLDDTGSRLLTRRESPTDPPNYFIRAGSALTQLTHFPNPAPQAAGVIHTDFEKGFIRAETITYADYVAFGGEAGARDAGKLRLEGKDYVVADGDVMHFRFNT